MNAEPHVDPENLLESLIEAGVFQLQADSIAFSDDFLRELDRTRDRLNGTSRDDKRPIVDAVTTDATETDTLLTLSDQVPAIVPEYLTLAEQTGLTHTDRLRTLPFFDTVLNSPPDGGAPEAFVSISGERLPLYVLLHDTAIIYVWRDDCPPCEEVRTTFDAIFDSAPTDIALFATYGPDAAKKLDEWYDVVGGPATLFFSDGQVEARMYGAYAQSVLETEIDRHRTD
ncbi:thioredoxin family protein [Halobellus captivus]|uniref:thioredoxin family protein n=1 Tax=Halobellus captivus TaxID=2592614 RepID=UPI0011A8BAE3|nr:thioredoxin family protein [Halobellus captivus]